MLLPHLRFPFTVLKRQTDHLSSLTVPPATDFSIPPPVIASQAREGAATSIDSSLFSPRFSGDSSKIGRLQLHSRQRRSSALSLSIVVHLLAQKTQGTAVAFRSGQ
ncbi:hypothetical protein JCGZ_20257 [Jatropha curcas]|uniref:Uncharacterized protein n=1 Tax=Jatropha curcas TaxID=180498 RepID=A0A067JU56_JATCU|nr:hypothetical protein JCGZ_20257 [Jatropha curcas]